MLNRRFLTVGGLVVAASSLTRVALAEGKPMLVPMLVFVGHEL